MDMNERQQVFAEAIKNLVVQSEEPPVTADNARLQEHVKTICSLLKIARCRALFFEISVHKGEESSIVPAITTIFEDRDADEQREFVTVRHTVEGNLAKYAVCPYAGAPDWTVEEVKLINEFLSSVFIINGRARALEIAERLSYYDSEMEVFNLRYLMKHLNRMISQNVISEYYCCRFNLKRFSSVNQRIGQRNGSLVMRRFVIGLQEILGKDGFLSRLGGDNFVTVFRKEKFPQVRDYLCGTTIQTDMEGLPEIVISAHAGYCMPEEFKAISQIMEKITVAVNTAKENPALSYVVYDENLQRRYESRKMVEGLFSGALAREEFIVYYQPKVNLKQYTMAGAEALCRWQHDGELIPPFRFIPILEQSNNICRLDFYMLDHVCRDLRGWLDKGKPIVKTSINMSRINLGNENLSKQIVEVVDKYNIPHEYIEIELTETTTDVDFKELKRVVNALHEAGISTSVDDFGVGYSSLNLIRDLPWNVLKIDRSFLPADEDENKKTKEIMLKAVITMAQELGLECVVEGVETMEQINLLKDYKCYCAQGFFFDKPLPIEAFEEKLLQYHESLKKEE